MSDPGTVHNWSGTRYQTILCTAETGGAMSIIYGEAGPFNGPPTHVHDNEDEVFIVLEGEVAFDLAGDRFTRGPMGTAFVPRGTPHSFMTGANGARCFTVLTPGGFEGFFAEMARGGFRIPQDLATVTAIAETYGSHIVGAGLAHQEVQHA